MKEPRAVRLLMTALLTAAQSVNVQTTLMSGSCAKPGAINGLSSTFEGLDGKMYRVAIEQVQR